jgi:rhodanese-related sulfurtransferase
MSTKELNTGIPAIRDVFPLEAQEIITKKRRDEDVIVVDVCTPKEFKRAHLENAVNIDYFSRSFKYRLSVLDRDKTYLVYCRMGGRSKLAQRTMKDLGFRKVFNVIGGTLLWEEEGLPFATGNGPGKWSICPISNTIVVTRWIRKSLQTVYRAAVDVLRALRFGNQARAVNGE